MKRLILALLCLALVLSFAPVSALAYFKNSGEYRAGQFSDVAPEEWFAGYVENAYNYGFMQGKGGGIFDPGGTMTLGEAVTLAARMRVISFGEDVVFAQSEPYYSVYADYALEQGIIKEHGKYDERITRAEFAELIRNALSEETLVQINEIPDYAICDVVPGDAYSDAIYTLYRAGIVVGSDEYGSFFPDSDITRAETCAILTRVAETVERMKISLPHSIPAQTLYQRSANAVVLIETYDKDGKLIRSGSAFFITADGLAVTNEHVLTGAKRAIVKLRDGRSYPVLGVRAISAEYNLAIFAVDCADERMNFLRLADSDLILSGNEVYAIGNPYEMEGSISAGVIANPSREVGGMSFFQFTAAISFGSGGGPVINTLGQVIGVASSSMNSGQRLNLAVPINLLRDMELADCIPLADLL